MAVELESRTVNVYKSSNADKVRREYRDMLSHSLMVEEKSKVLPNLLHNYGLLFFSSSNVLMYNFPKAPPASTNSLLEPTLASFCLVPVPLVSDFYMAAPHSWQQILPVIYCSVTKYTGLMACDNSHLLILHNFLVRDLGRAQLGDSSAL